MEQNLNSFDFSLSSNEMQEIATFNQADAGFVNFQDPNAVMPHYSFPYQASSTGSSHSVLLPGFALAWKVRCWNHSPAEAPCQCFTPSGIVTETPGTIFCGSFPQIW